MPRSNARQLLLQALQRLGYALLLPLSILPLAALLYRLGQPDVLDLALLSLTGRTLLSQMPLIYAVAIAFGLSRQGQGTQALAGAVNFLLLTGLSLAVCRDLGIKLGRDFSAGLQDLVLSYHAGEHSLWLIPAGILFFVACPLLFYRLLIQAPLSLPRKSFAREHPRLASVAPSDTQMLAIQYLKALGGMDNLQAMNLYLTRLSLRVRDTALVDQSRLLALGCLSWIVLNDHQLVLVLGPNAGLIEAQIRMLAERQSVPLGLKPNEESVSQSS